VSTIDLVPTVLSLLGVDSTLSYSLSGEPLGTEPPDRPLFASQIGDGYKQRAVYAGEYKLTRQCHDDVTLLYRLDNRQRERDRVADPEREAALAATLPDEKWDQPSDSIDLAESTKKRLRDLGYVDE
jgi:arylsulfatase A-like enzyme